MSVRDGSGRGFHRAGIVMLVAGIMALGIRLILVAVHRRFDWGDVFLAVVAAGAAIVGFHTIRVQRGG